MSAPNDTPAPAPKSGYTNTTRPPTSDGISVHQGNFTEFSDAVVTNPEPGQDPHTGLKPDRS